jgi:hypothetical protein
LRGLWPRGERRPADVIGTGLLVDPGTGAQRVTRAVLSGQLLQSDEAKRANTLRHVASRKP